MPPDLTGNAVERWKLEFMETDAGRAWNRGQYLYHFKVNADGSFTLPEVLPGKYRLFVDVAQGYMGSGPDTVKTFGGDPRIAWAGTKFTVPDASGSDFAPVYLGEITLVPDH
jgi:hypothetical protein